ncbi:hypothetical protein ABT324_06505 [Saccharopolyspora sp. NPDC000359]|uniref:hypothetical protein n=1 Tax=Saccharopolyspora sp. NPDC000359 TaxID=3154251 RepID=UPI0033287B2A
MTGKPGRREAAIDPEEGPLAKFAHELRMLRQQAGGPSFQELSRQSRQLGEPFSTSTMRNAVSGSVLPTAEVTATFVRACLRHARLNRHLLADPAVLDHDVAELVDRWCQRRNELARPAPAAEPPAAAASPEPVGRPAPAAAPEPAVPPAAAALPTPAAPPETAAQPEETASQPEEPDSPEPARRPDRRRRMAVVGAATVAVLGGVAAAVGFLVPAGKEAPLAKPIVAKTATPVSADQIAQQCRGAWERGPVKVDPCISTSPEGVRISVRVSSVDAAPEVAVHLWLRDTTTAQRVPDTLHHCQLAFTAPGQAATCGPVLVHPQPGHDYVTAASSETGTSPVPFMWEDANATGLNSAAVTWPPR